MYICGCVYIYMCVYVYAHVNICIHIYIYINIYIERERDILQILMHRYYVNTYIDTDR